MAPSPPKPQRRTPSPVPPSSSSSRQQPQPQPPSLTGRARELPPPPRAPPRQQESLGESLGFGALREPENQLALIYLALVMMASYVVVRLVRALLFFGPLILMGLAFTKPDVHRFEEALRLLEKKHDDGDAGMQQATSSSSSSSSPSSSASGGGGGSGWLMNLVRGASALLGRNPARDWCHLDLVCVVLAKKRDAATRPGDGPAFALGVCRHWILLDAASVRRWPWLPYLHQAAGLVAALVPEQHWGAFPTSGSRQQQQHLQQHAELQQGVDTLLSAAAAAAGGVLSTVAGSHTSGSRHSSSSLSPRARGSNSHSPRRHHNNHHSPRHHHHQQQQHQQQHQDSHVSEHGIKAYMRRAQSLAEAGRFVEAGATVEEGLAKCRPLRGGAEEETELWMVGAAFYEAASSSAVAVASGGGGFTGRLRCLQRAAELGVRLGRWAKAAELFDEGAQAWWEEKRRGTPFGLVATGKATPLALSAVLAEARFGDAVKARQLHRMACLADAAHGRTPEAALAAAVLEALQSTHDAGAIREARARFVAAQAGRGEGRQLELWQEEALRELAGRVEAGAHLS